MRFGSILFWENILELDVKFFNHAFQLAQGQMMFAAFEPMKGGMREANLLGEFCVGKTAPFFLQKRCQLPFQMSPHLVRMTESL